MPSSQIKFNVLLRTIEESNVHVMYL